MTVQWSPVNTDSAPGAIQGTTPWLISGNVGLISGSGEQDVYITNTLANPVPITGDISVTSEGVHNTYSVATLSIPLASTATDVFTISGSSTRIIKVTKISITGVASTSASTPIQIIKRTGVNTGGTRTSITAVALDSENESPAATLEYYTTNATNLGNGLGNIEAWRQFIPSPFGASNPPTSFDYGTRNSQAIVLHGTNEVLAINMNGITPNDTLLDIAIEWIEVDL
jgi:hypothetical protein